MNPTCFGTLRGFYKHKQKSNMYMKTCHRLNTDSQRMFPSIAMLLTYTKTIYQKYRNLTQIEYQRMFPSIAILLTYSKTIYQKYRNLRAAEEKIAFSQARNESKLTFHLELSEIPGTLQKMMDQHL